MCKSSKGNMCTRWFNLKTGKCLYHISRSRKLPDCFGLWGKWGDLWIPLLVPTAERHSPACTLQCSLSPEYQSCLPRQGSLTVPHAWPTWDLCLVVPPRPHVVAHSFPSSKTEPEHPKLMSPTLITFSIPAGDTCGLSLTQCLAHGADTVSGRSFIILASGAFSPKWQDTDCLV